MLNFFKGQGSIFMLHRVAPYNKKNIVFNENLKISPDDLEKFIQILLRDNYEFLSLQDLVNNSRAGKKTRRRFIIFTLDDGYKDNLEFALPLFKKYEIPFCVYVTNSFPNKTTDLWWYALEAAILQNDYLIDNNAILNKTLWQKQQNFLILRKKIIGEKFRDPLNYLKSFGDFSFDLNTMIEDICMSWEDILQLSQDPLVTIGCHTMNHYPLANLSDEGVKEEILSSKKELEDRIGKDVLHFCFPFGTPREAGRREYNISAELGFETIVTAVPGNVAGPSDLFKLNRVFLHPISPDPNHLYRLMYWNLKCLYTSTIKTICNQA